MVDTEIDELEVLIAVVKHGNFSRAADVMGVAASAISRSIQKLERKLAANIFNRTTRSMALTQEGQWLYQRAVDIVDRVTTVEDYFSGANTHPQGILRVHSATPFILHAIAPLIPGFRRKFRQVEVRLSSGESVVDLIARDVDVAVRLGQLGDSTLKARRLGTTYRKLYAAPSYLREHGPIVSAQQLALHSCLGFAQPERLNTWPVRGDGGELISIRPQVTADSGETLKQLAIHGCGIACVSSFTAAQDVRAGRLVAVLAKETEAIGVPVYAVFYSDNEINIRLRCFLDYLQKHISFGP